MPCISLPGTSVSKSFTLCQIMSSLARLSTFESTVSTDKAFASTIKGALRSAESKLSYFTFTNVRALGIGVKLSLASVINASEPSAPHNTRVISKRSSASFRAFFKSYPVKKRLSGGNFATICLRLVRQTCSVTCIACAANVLGAGKPCERSVSSKEPSANTACSEST
ncbi:Uncharacterised protein [Vibrio cholerae]|nr:Uncharacterised protein [Vibrio cholerae]CRZ61115.1 Uncharacterised protein [Vibrio cholerae]CRZ61432.1 Uncharacterised protein [Vibrio cholerae]CRZ62283.1 Uncharacterised protein [Vibrio cholerae]CRZ68240.1 Uncharacterised protein [Vibrio cholerae]